MTETRDELFTAGYRPGGMTFLADLDIVYKTQCPKCKDPKPKGGLRHETWRKTGHTDKCFTVCRSCGHRRPF